MLDEHSDGSSAAPGQADRKSVFFSYRRLDDQPPPENPDADGFVRYLWKQLQYELSQRGAADAILWRDRGKIEPADDFTDKIMQALREADLFLAVLSRNYIDSSWCNREIATFADRLSQTQGQADRPRIFRIDKNRVPESSVPDHLKGVEFIKLYEEDPESGRESEYFWRGKVTNERLYLKAIGDLGWAIYKRLSELGKLQRSTPCAPGGLAELAPPAFAPQAVVPQNGRTVFVAKPAADMSPTYTGLVRELTQRGFRVVPDPASAPPDAAEALVAAVEEGLAAAELSVHLLGERRGCRPDGLDTEMVPFQLERAAAEAARRPSFKRLIWAPKTLVVQQGFDEKLAPVVRTRDPLDVLSAFASPLACDQVDGDTEAKFKEFVVQHLERRPDPPPAPRPRRVHIRFEPSDSALARDVGRAVKELGLVPCPSPQDGSAEERATADRRLLANADHVIVCWGQASEAAVVGRLADEELMRWRDTHAGTARLLVVVGPPAGEAKTARLEDGFGPDADQVVDGTGAPIAGGLRSALVSANGAMP